MTGLHEHGQSKLEFALILVLVLAAVVVIVAVVGSHVGNGFANTTSTP